MSKLQCISPIDGSVYVERRLASNPEIQAALAQAELAQRAWKQVPLSERIAIARRAIAASSSSVCASLHSISKPFETRPKSSSSAIRWNIARLAKCKSRNSGAERRTCALVADRMKCRPQRISAGSIRGLM